MVIVVNGRILNEEDTNLIFMKFNLEERLIDYSVLILDIVDVMEDNKGSNHLASQIVRSGTAPALLYGEAQSAESRKDFYS
jgi:four helix bundle protein